MDTGSKASPKRKVIARRKLKFMEHTLDDAILWRRCPLDNGRFQLEPRHTLGSLDILPPEIINEILLELDVPSITTFRRVNRRAMIAVDSLPQYFRIWQNCPDVLRAALSIEATSFTLRILYDTISTSKCSTCSQFGNYIYLITCRRVCRSCLKWTTNYRTWSWTEASQTSGLSWEECKKLPHVLRLPGTYSEDRDKVEVRQLLFDRQLVLHKAEEAGAPPPPCRSNEDEDCRYMSVISAPLLGASGEAADWGVWCLHCKDHVTGQRVKIKYTAAGILEHARLSHDGATVVIK